MSIFNAEDQAAVLNPEDLIGDGKKYANQDEANRALAHSQAYIKKLESEHEEMRAEIAASTRIEELLKQVNQNTPTPVTQVNTTPTVAPVKEVDVSDIDERIRAGISQAETQKQVAGNVNAVAQKLLEAFGSGDKARQYVEKRALELGVGMNFLEEVAAKSPEAFYNTIGLNTQPTNNPGASKSDVNTATFNSGSTVVKPGTYAWYNQIKEADKTAYWSPKVQSQMMKDALEKGDDFYT